jgi:hypothetical protein
LGPVNVWGSLFAFYDSCKSRNSFPSSKFALSKGNTTFGDSVRQGITQDHATTVRRRSCTKRCRGTTAGVLKHRGIRASMKLHQEHDSYQGSVPKVLGSSRQDQADLSWRQYVGQGAVRWLLCLLAVVRFMQRRDYAEEMVVLRFWPTAKSRGVSNARQNFDDSCIDRRVWFLSVGKFMQQGSYAKEGSYQYPVCSALGNLYTARQPATGVIHPVIELR